MQSQSTFEKLEEQLHHPRDWRLRQSAIKELSEYNTQEAMNLILEALYDESPHVVETSAHALEKYGQSAKDGLLKAAFSPKKIPSRRFILFTLDKLRDVDLIPTFIDFLQHEDPYMCDAAARGLTHLPDPRSLPHLLKALQRQDVSKIQIIDALDALHDPQIVPHIKDLIYDENFIVCRHVAIALGHFKTSKVENILIEASQHKNDFAKQAAAEGLGMINSDRCYNRLIEMLAEDNLARPTTIITLGKTQRPEVVPVLLSLIGHRDHNVRSALRVALGDTGDLRVTLPLLKWYRKDDMHDGGGLWNLVAAYWQLDEGKADQAKQAKIIDAIDSDDIHLQICAIWFFTNISFNYVESTNIEIIDLQLKHMDKFVSLMSNDNADLRLTALVCLSHKAIPLVVDILIELLDDDDRLIQQMAAKALEFGDSQDGINALCETAQSSDERLRRQSIQSLRPIGGDQAIDVFIKSLKHEDKWTRSNAAWGLEMTRSPQAIQPLIEALKSESDDETLASMLMSVGRFESDKITSFVIDMLKNGWETKKLSRSVIDAALHALMMHNNDTALPIVTNIVNESKIWQHQMHAVQVLSRIGKERQRADRMFDLLAHENDTVRTTASQELGYLGARTEDLDLRDYIVNNLINRLSDTGSGYHYSPTVAHMAAKSLYFVGTSDAIVALEKWHDEQDHID